MIRILVLIILSSTLTFAQPFTSTIRGTVRDADSGIPMEHAAVKLAATSQATTTAQNGTFRFDKVPVGRYSLQVTYVGYEPVVIPEILLESGKESVLDVKLSPAARQLNEATVLTSRPAAFNSLQAITTEQTLRYAATYLDPARVATSFAGVAATNDQANGLVIRGNSPNSMQWRLEGAEIVNPNHLSNAGTFSDRATQTGGGVNILSTQLLGTSYFLTGAFPAQYGNALSGILDMNLRKGNDEKQEFTAQAGLIGLDIAAEGPFSKNTKASYLANYRYSFTGLLGAMGVSFGGEDIRFQDFSFHINLPTEKAGTFSLFGLGGISSNVFKAEKDTSAWEFQKDGFDISYHNKMGAAGATHQISLGSRASVNTVFVTSGLVTSRQAYRINKVDFAEKILTESDKQSKGRVSLNSTLTYRFTEKSRLKTGLFLTWQTDAFSMPDLVQNDARQINGFVLQPFASWTYHITPAITSEIGLHNLYYSVSKSNSLEPRAALRWQLNPGTQLSFSYGLHSQLQLPQVYLSDLFKGAEAASNRNIDPSKSHHFVIGFQKNFRKGNNLKIEAYWQHLYHIPVSATSINSFSVINLIESYVNQKLANTGTGRNYGMEATYQKLLTDQYYILLSGSLYDATYVGSDGIRRDSRFNGRHTFSFTGGKEFRNQRQDTWGMNVKILWIGGFRDTPVDHLRSQETGVTSYIQDQAFTVKMKDYFRPDIRIYWKKSKASYSRTLALDLQNVSATKNEAYSYYDTYQKRIVHQNQLGLIPVLSYRWEF